MNIVWLFCAVFLQYCIHHVLPAGHFGESDKSPNWVDSLIKHIKKNTNVQQVMLITNFEKNESMETLPSIDELITKIVQKFPTLRINVAKFNELKKSILNHEIVDDTFFDSSTTFFILVHHSLEEFDTLPLQKTVDTMLEISASKLGSQFLLILISNKLSDSLEEFLKYAWIQQLLDFTIIEFVEIQIPGILNSADYEAVTPIIHQINPFKEEYTRTSWTLDIEWFPDKMLDMWGHPLKIAVINRPPFSVAKFNEFMEPVEVEGANIQFLKIIAKKLNFTVKYTPKLAKFEEIGKTGDPTGLYELMQSGKVDLIAYLSPHYSATTNNLQTTPILLNNLCTVVPILPRVAMPVSLGFFEAYFVYFGIVVLFWFFSHILRFKSLSWYPFNITRILLGISVIWKPMRMSERTLYTCLLLVSAISSSSIYAAITGISLQTNADMEFTSFSDLENSNLAPMINSYLFNKTFGSSDDTLMKLKEKVVLINGSPLTTCPKEAAKHKNVSCLLLNDEATTAVQNSARHGHPKIKLTEVCFWSDSTGFLLGKGSPYRSRINHVISLLKDVGLLEKCYEQKAFKISNGSTDDDNDSGLDKRQNMMDLRRQLYAIVIVGYTVSISAFIGEIIVDRILRCENVKKAIFRK